VARLITPVLAYALRGGALARTPGRWARHVALHVRAAPLRRYRWKTIAAGLVFFALSIAALSIIP